MVNIKRNTAISPEVEADDEENEASFGAVDVCNEAVSFMTHSTKYI